MKSDFLILRWVSSRSPKNKNLSNGQEFLRDQDLLFFQLDLIPDDHAIKIIVNDQVKKKQDLLKLLSKSLRFPEYFSENFDALYDCMSDLNWIKEKKIQIIHDLPFLEIPDVSVYLELLLDLLRMKNKTHEIEIWFREMDRPEIENWLSEFERS